MWGLFNVGVLLNKTMTNCRVLLINDLTFFDDPNCSGLGLELAQSRYARRDKAHKSLLGDLALWLRSAYGAHSSPRHKELVAPLQQVASSLLVISTLPQYARAPI
jgi:hypothetical protein